MIKGAHTEIETAMVPEAGNTSDASGMASARSMTPDALALFNCHLNELKSAVEFLPDKPEETPITTLAALWQLAAGNSVSVQRAAVGALPSLDDTQITNLAKFVRARIEGTPLAYLTQRQQFMGLELIVTAEALIPRNETALLGNAALIQVREIVQNQGRARVLDICTGSGNVALALASHEPAAHVWAADLSEDAIALARRNLALLDLGTRVEFRSGDLLTPFDTPEFHTPSIYLSVTPLHIQRQGRWHGREIIGHEPRLAFDGGPPGIRILLRLAAEAPRFCVPAASCL
ncbi:MAG: HemK family protein methyltransferase [Betaproteobacteria bacterium]|nr:HemK family protein methyltransferase [Betaproteobacteria bacterium]